MMRGWLPVAGLLLLPLLASCGSSDPAAVVQAGPSAEQSGYVRVPGSPLGPARQTVTDLDGKSWRFDQAAAGKLTLVYFGYTSCPDVCPTTMADLAVALRGLPSQARDRVEVRFVSTDPHRDTPNQIRQWLDGFDRRFIGSRAPIADVVAAARTYGIGIDPPRVSGADYQVTHGAQLLVLRPGGGAVGYFRELAGAKQYTKLLPSLVDQYAKTSRS